MTVTVVPIQRLRRATTGWSYKIPTSTPIQPGALVIIPFRGHPTLGIVWDTEETGKATEAVSQVLTHTPLVRAPHRALIEWLSDEALTSLSTALYTWLPKALRELPLTKPVKEILEHWDRNQPTAKDIALSKQHAVLTPSQRHIAEHSLSQKYVEHFQSTFADTTPAQEFLTWVDIAQGRTTIATGRERSLFAPWINLRHVTVIEPEDISFQTGQSPYFSAVKAAEALASFTQAELRCRTTIPVLPARSVWKSAAGLPTTIPPVELTDLRKERLLNPNLIENIKKTIENGKKVVILYNAHDRTKLLEDGSKLVIPGIETVGRQLASALGLETLPPSIILGTRSSLHDIQGSVGLSVILSLDPLLAQSGFADQLHGWGDLGRLSQLGAPLIIQTKSPEHALPQALLQGKFEEYCARVIREAQNAHIPPFSEFIVCATPTSELANPVYDRLLPLIQPPWILGHPREVNRRGKPHTIITLQAPLGERLPLKLKKELAELPRPWKIERDPWYAG